MAVELARAGGNSQNAGRGVGNDRAEGEGMPNIVDKVVFNGCVGAVVWGCFLASGVLWLCRMIWLGVLVVWVGASRAFRLLTSDSNAALAIWLALACCILGWLIGGKF